jgi:hypothetical protein
MGLHQGLATKTGWCRRWTRRFRRQALELLKHPDHGREAGMQMAITAPQGTQAGFPHRQLQPGMVVAMEGDEVQQIGGTGLEAWSDGRERGLLLNLDAIHGVAQRFELVQKLSITRSRICGWGNDWQGRDSIRSKV